MKAADLLDTTHPLHKAFTAFCKGNPPTKRAARKFLAKYPFYGEIQKG